MPRTARASVGGVCYHVLNRGNAQREVFHPSEYYKAFPIQQDEHLLTVLRYVERNPLRAKLVDRAQDWPWSSLTVLYASPPALILHPSRCPRGDGWLRLVNRPQTQAALEVVRTCVKRGTPFGRQRWQEETARRMGLEFTLRPRGRPKKDPEK
jgi:putative transposase